MNWTLETIEQYPLLAGLINSLSCQNYDMYQKIKDGNIHILVVVFSDEIPVQYLIDTEDLTIKKIHHKTLKNHQVSLKEWFLASDYFEQIKKRFGFIDRLQWLANNYILVQEFDRNNKIYQSKKSLATFTGLELVDIYWQQKKKFEEREFNIIKREFLKQVLGDKILKH